MPKTKPGPKPKPEPQAIWLKLVHLVGSRGEPGGPRYIVHRVRNTLAVLPRDLLTQDQVQQLINGGYTVVVTEGETLIGGCGAPTLPRPTTPNGGN